MVVDVVIKKILLTFLYVAVRMFTIFNKKTKSSSDRTNSILSR